jgi:hypothetical protein
METKLSDIYRMHRSGDAWGDCMAFHFAICDELTWRGACVPDRWRYRRGAAAVSSPQDAEDAGLREDLEPFDAPELVAFGDKLARLADILRAQGRNY